MTDELLLEKEEGVAILTFNRPEKMNAITGEMWQGIRDAVAEVKGDDALKALVITGAGRAFCTGADVEKRLVARLAGEKFQTKRSQMVEPVGYVAELIRGLNKPIIAAINGTVAGAGLSIALVSDIRIASEKARFSAVWSKMGLVPDLGCTGTLPAVIGMDKALELMWSAKVIDAQEAERIGLVTRVVAHEEVMTASMQLARQLAQGPSVAIEWIKKIAYAGQGKSLAEQLSLEGYAQVTCRGTQDHKEAVAAFMEKRAPVFQGR